MWITKNKEVIEEREGYGSHETKDVIEERGKGDSQKDDEGSLGWQPREQHVQIWVG